jgi:CopG family transcriptional regulator/antitoxin EndoAI
MPSQNLSLPRKRESRELAKQDNRNKSELLREALRRYLEGREWQDVLKYAKKKSIQKGIFTEVDIENIVDEVRRKEKGGHIFLS